MAQVTLVLVHGGQMTGRYWDRVVPALAHPALAIDLPGRAGRPADPMTLTVGDCGASIAADVEAAGLTDVVMVAHSSGGLFVPAAVARLHRRGAVRVHHVVLDVAQVPPEGGCGLDAMKESHRRRNIEAREWAEREGQVLQTPGPLEDPEPLRHAYGVELDDESIAFVNAPERTVRDSMNVYFQPVSWASIADVPVTYVRHTRDRPTPPELQDRNIANLPGLEEVVELDTGHVPAVTHPVELAAVLDAVADRVDAGLADPAVPARTEEGSR